MTASSISEGARFRSDEEGGSAGSEQWTLPHVAVQDVYSGFKKFTQVHRMNFEERSVEGYYYGK